MFFWRSSPYRCDDMCSVHQDMDRQTQAPASTENKSIVNASPLPPRFPIPPFRVGCGKYFVRVPGPRRRKTPSSTSQDVNGRAIKRSRIDSQQSSALLFNKSHVATKRSDFDVGNGTITSASVSANTYTNTTTPTNGVAWPPWHIRKAIFEFYSRPPVQMTRPVVGTPRCILYELASRTSRFRSLRDQDPDGSLGLYERRQRGPTWHKERLGHLTGSRLLEACGLFGLEKMRQVYFEVYDPDHPECVKRFSDSQPSSNAQTVAKVPSVAQSDITGPDANALNPTPATAAQSSSVVAPFANQTATKLGSASDAERSLQIESSNGDIILAPDAPAPIIASQQPPPSSFTTAALDQSVMSNQMRSSLETSESATMPNVLSLSASASTPSLPASASTNAPLDDQTRLDRLTKGSREWFELAESLRSRESMAWGVEHEDDAVATFLHHLGDTFDIELFESPLCKPQLPRDLVDTVFDTHRQLYPDGGWDFKKDWFAWQDMLRDSPDATGIEHSTGLAFALEVKAPYHDRMPEPYKKPKWYQAPQQQSHTLIDAPTSLRPVSNASDAFGNRDYMSTDKSATTTNAITSPAIRARTNACASNSNTVSNQATGVVPDGKSNAKTTSKLLISHCYLVSWGPLKTKIWKMKRDLAFWRLALPLLMYLHKHGMERTPPTAVFDSKLVSALKRYCTQNAESAEYIGEYDSVYKG